MRVYLTGGTGLVGSHVAERLRARDDEVVCLKRPRSTSTFPESLECSIAEGDVRDDPGDLASEMKGCDAVVHAAALVYPGGRWPRIRAVNVEGTMNVLAAASRVGVRRVIFLSSIAVYGTPHAEWPVDETTPIDTPIPPADLYARSKREAEAGAREAAEREKLKLLILRPGAVYGERDRLLAPRIHALRTWPAVPVMGEGDNTLPVVYAGNVAAAVELALDATGLEETSRVYNVARDHPVTQEQLVRGLLRESEKPTRIVRVPAPLVRAAARLGETLNLPVPGAGGLAMARVARLALSDNPYPSDRIRKELGWTPPFTHEEGLARTAAWLEGREEAEGTEEREGGEERS